MGFEPTTFCMASVPAERRKIARQLFGAEPKAESEQTRERPDWDEDRAADDHGAFLHSLLTTPKHAYLQPKPEEPSDDPEAGLPPKDKRFEDWTAAESAAFNAGFEDRMQAIAERRERGRREAEQRIEDEANRTPAQHLGDWIVAAGRPYAKRAADEAFIRSIHGGVGDLPPNHPGFDGGARFDLNQPSPESRHQPITYPVGDGWYEVEIEDGAKLLFPWIEK